MRCGAVAVEGGRARSRAERPTALDRPRSPRLASFSAIGAPSTAAGGGAYSEDLRWLVVYKRLILGEDHAAVTEALCGKLCKKTQSEIIERFLATGDVKTWKGRREAPPANKVVHAEDDLWLLGSVIDDPAATLEARTAEFALAMGKRVHVSTVCRALHRMGLSYQKVARGQSNTQRAMHTPLARTRGQQCRCAPCPRPPSMGMSMSPPSTVARRSPLTSRARASQMQHWATQRDDAKAVAFWNELMTFHSIEDLLVIDETAKDNRDLKGSFGWGARGCPPVEGRLPLGRDVRVSALCVLSHRGFASPSHKCAPPRLAPRTSVLRGPRGFVFSIIINPPRVSFTSRVRSRGGKACGRRRGGARAHTSRYS